MPSRYRWRDCRRTRTCREDALVLQEKLTFFREEQAEPREVDLLLIGFDLGEVRVDRDVGHEVLRDAVFDIEPDVPVQLVGERR